MANNPQFPGGGQFRPIVPAQQGQPFIPVASQQFRPVGQGMPSSHVGMPAAQSQPLQFLQPIQRLPPWTNQPGPGAPSAQALSMPYVQPNRPLTSSQTQQTAPPLSNHMHGVGTSGIPISAPYAFAPSSFGLTQNSASALPQFPTMSQMHATVVSVGGQSWLSSGSNGASLVPPVQPAVAQISISSSSDSAIAVSSNSQQSLNDWREQTASDGRSHSYVRFERAKEKEGKEAKKQQRLTNDFTKLLYTFKEVIASSNWEDCKQLFEESQEYRSIGEESLIKEIFEEYVTHLQERAKEKEHKHKEEKEFFLTSQTNMKCFTLVGAQDKNFETLERHQSATGDANSDKDGKEESKKSRRPSSDCKKLRKHAYNPKSDGENHESRQKSHKRDNQDGSHRNGGYEQLEDGELANNLWQQRLISEFREMESGDKKLKSWEIINF
ncbi:hypothetical protein NC653_006212 [Populus alba x Populus x berolinensis]|uniref:Pre-mRNA-processing protein 40A-like n=1 Tax=Populus alba x Populus x berolinensis TaxID=444605 RepID=A0AAD6WCB0_9ROSI|nr:hypothetical protein NC653_006212 [Populus alba x Populus x berolinensis]